MTANNKELLRNIGRRLREAPELGAAEPLSHEIKRHLELLKNSETGADAPGVRENSDATDERVTTE